MKSSTITAIGIAASAFMNFSNASTAMAQCTTEIISIPYHVSPVGGTGVSCGACKTISAGTTISYSIVITPGGVGGSIGGSVTVTHGFQVCAGECNMCNFAVATTDARYIEETCWDYPWYDVFGWGRVYKTVSRRILDPGTVSIIPQCHESESISCLCRAAGHSCECDGDGGPPVPDDRPRRDRQASAISNPVTSVDVRQFLTTDTSGRTARGLKGLSRHDLVVLSACLPLDRPNVGIAPSRPGSTKNPKDISTQDKGRIALVFDGESVEIHNPKSLRDVIKKLDRSIVSSGAHLDVDGNGVVDQVDVQIVLQNLGARGGVDLAFNHYADVDANGTVNDQDLMLVTAAL